MGGVQEVSGSGCNSSRTHLHPKAVSVAKSLVAALLFCCGLQAATEDKVTIALSGGDYTKLVNWEAGEDDTGDLVSRGVFHVAEITGDWSSVADTNAVTILGWTTGADNYIEVRTAGSARHAGKWDETKYRLSVTNAACHVNEDYVRIDGLQIGFAGTANSYALRFSNIGAANYLVVRNCLLKSTAPSGTHYAVYLNDPDINSHVYNVVAFGNWNSGIIADALSSAAIMNCTVYGATNGFRQAGGLGVTNCIAQACYNGFYTVTNALNNCSDIQSDAPGSGSRTGTVSFVDIANGDFHLQASDTIAKDYGADLSGSFTTDIDGETRSGTWDIGADEVMSTSTPLLKPRRAIILHY